jgi:hypothetical protein
MSCYVLVFDRPIDVSNPGQDGDTWRFPLSIVESDYVGQPDEGAHTRSIHLDVAASRSRTATWDLSGNELMRVLFEIGRRELIDRLGSGSPKDVERVVVSTRTHTSTPPFDPSRIDDPAGASYTIEVQATVGFLPGTSR